MGMAIGSAAGGTAGFAAGGASYAYRSEIASVAISAQGFLEKLNFQAISALVPGTVMQYRFSLLHGSLLDPRFTAADPAFPIFEPNDKSAICFNLKPKDVPQTPDPYFQWQGTYFKINRDGTPIHQSWREGLHAIARSEGAELVLKYCETMSRESDEVYYSPAKAKRWGLKGPDPLKPINMENLLIKRQLRWIHVEVSENQGQVRGEEFSIDAAHLLSRITYPFFTIHSPQEREAQKVYGNDDPSQNAWLWGSSLIVERPHGCGDTNSHVLTSVPSVFTPVRFVPLNSREAFIHKVASTPSAVITGATVEKGSQFASPFSTQIGNQIGKLCGKKAGITGINVMINASMKGHLATMCADDDFSAGFESQSGCKVASVKGLNMVQLHGDAWKVQSGVGYVLEEREDDFSNHAKEACLTAAASNPWSIILAANGGPTVSVNLARFLMLSSSNRVFAINGMHSEAGKSGASGSFKTTPESLDNAANSLNILAPCFFQDKVKTGKDLQDELKKKPLTLLDLDLSSGKGCTMVSTYWRRVKKIQRSLQVFQHHDNCHLIAQQQLMSSCSKWPLLSVRENVWCKLTKVNSAT